MNKKKKYIAVFMLKEQNSYTIQKKKKIDFLENKITFRNNSYIYNISIPSFSRGLKQYFCFDINKTNGHLVFVKNKNNLITPEIIDMICSKHTIKDLTTNLTDTAFKVNMMMVIIGLIIGGLIGWIAGGFVSNG